MLTTPLPIDKQLVLSPPEGHPWAGEMVLNPAIIHDESAKRIHMLFRATNAWPQKQLPGKPLPYPIFLGYGWSEDRGKTWQFDLEKPALSPQLAYDLEDIRIEDVNGNTVTNYANGCIEDPRLFYLEGDCYCITACRMFPPGPYWEHDEPTQCAPGWALNPQNPLGKAASENFTVNVLWKVNLDALTRQDYEAAFIYVTHLTDAEFGEDRDVLIFPERLIIDGKSKYVMLQRPYNPGNYPFFDEDLKPSIIITSADTLEDFTKPALPRYLLAKPEFTWEGNRIGASTPPISLGNGEWLLNYHGKQDAEVGYTQSFMILKEQPTGLPQIIHRASERMIIADQDWEMPNKFKTPCVFITGMIRMQDLLIASYGAADEKVGVLRTHFDSLIDYVRNFDANGNPN